MTFSTRTSIAMLLFLGPTLSAQRATPGGGAPPPSCPAALTAIRSGPRDLAYERALSRILGCGTEARSAVAHRIRHERTSGDIAALGRLNHFLNAWPSGEVLDAVMDVARDPSASRPARISALAALVRVTHPYKLVDYRSVTGEIDALGVPVSGCFSGEVTAHRPDRVLIRSDVARIRELAWTLRRDSKQPKDVRAAASCIIS